MLSYLKSFDFQTIWIGEMSNFHDIFLMPSKIVDSDRWCISFAWITHYIFLFPCVDFLKKIVGYYLFATLSLSHTRVRARTHTMCLTCLAYLLKWQGLSQFLLMKIVTNFWDCKIVYVIDEDNARGCTCIQLHKKETHTPNIQVL